MTAIFATSLGNLRHRGAGFRLTPTAPTHDRLAELTRRDRIDVLQRLATQAERDGVRILVDRRTGQHVALDAGDTPYCSLVDITGCSCRYFGVWHRCGHYALFLSQTGNIPDPDDPGITVIVGDVIEEVSA
jgi:hypothetical protein